VISRILDSKKSSATQQMKAGDLSSGVSPRRLNERASALGRKGMRERRTRTPDPPHPSFTGSQGYATGGTVQSDLARAPVAFPAPPPHRRIPSRVRNPASQQHDRFLRPPCAGRNGKQSEAKPPGGRRYVRCPWTDGSEAIACGAGLGAWRAGLISL
jgi:hypothetical protein